MSLKPLPKGRVEEVLVDKRTAAQLQLESAIWLWFNVGDPVSVHMLAVAAHDCLNALVKHATGKESELREWLLRLSKGRQKRVRIAQNFFKHGAIDLRAKVLLATIDAETFMMDAVLSYEILTKDRRPLFRLYAQRFLYEHPSLITEEGLPVFTKNFEVHQLADTTRQEFFLRLYPIFVDRYARGTHSGSPPEIP